MDHRHRWIWNSLVSIWILILLKPDGYRTELVKVIVNGTTVLRSDPRSPFFSYDTKKGTSVPVNPGHNGGWLPIPTPFYTGNGKKPGIPPQGPPLLLKNDAPPPGNALGRPYGPRAINFHPVPPQQHPPLGQQHSPQGQQHSPQQLHSPPQQHSQQNQHSPQGQQHSPQQQHLTLVPPPPTPAQGLKIMRPSQPEPIPMASNQQENVFYRNHQPPLPYVPGPGSNTIDTQPSPVDDSPKTSEEQSELRFLFHRPEDEDLIKSTIRDESEKYNERVSFIRGPTLKFHRRQTIYLPPRKKSVIYVMLKEPLVQTDLEVVEPAVDPTPEVNIIYEKAGPVRTKHYYSTSEKHGGTVGEGSHQLGSASEVNTVTVVPPSSTSNPPGAQKVHVRSIPPANPCQPSFSKKLRK